MGLRLSFSKRAESMSERGSGKRFFNDGNIAPLQLLEAKPLSLGVVLMRYQPAKKER